MHRMKRWIPFLKSDPVVAVVRLQGVIAASPRSGVLNDAALAPVLERAFRKRKPSAVALVINSPGGSPSQSSLIASRIKRLSAELEVPVHAFVEDVAASGGYYLATAADEIWLDNHSIVGSIGVISAGFGFSKFITRHGIDRRVYTAGKSKSMLDPFSPENPEDIARLKGLQEQIHETFIAHVKDGRGDRLTTEADLFTGEVWVGEKAVNLGLADGTAHLVPKMKELFGDKVRFLSYGLRRPLFQRFGTQLVSSVSHGLEEQALWARYGL